MWYTAPPPATRSRERICSGSGPNPIPEPCVEVEMTPATVCPSYPPMFERASPWASRWAFSSRSRMPAGADEAGSIHARAEQLRLEIEDAAQAGGVDQKAGREGHVRPRVPGRDRAYGTERPPGLR